MTHNFVLKTISWLNLVRRYFFMKSLAVSIWRGLLRLSRQKKVSRLLINLLTPNKNLLVLNGLRAPSGILNAAAPKWTITLSVIGLTSFSEEGHFAGL